MATVNTVIPAKAPGCRPEAKPKDLLLAPHRHQSRSFAALRMTRFLLLAFALLLWPLFAAAAPRIGVMTMQPGEVFWERFGHNAIVVDDPQRGEPKEPDRSPS